MRNKIVVISVLMLVLSIVLTVWYMVVAYGQCTTGLGRIFQMFLILFAMDSIIEWGITIYKLVQEQRRRYLQAKKYKESEIKITVPTHDVLTGNNRIMVVRVPKAFMKGNNNGR